MRSGGIGGGVRFNVVQNLRGMVGVKVRIPVTVIKVLSSLLT